MYHSTSLINQNKNTSSIVQMQNTIWHWHVNNILLPLL